MAENENKKVLDEKSEEQIEKKKNDAWEKYGEYFKNRTVADIMAEWSEAQDEWIKIKDDKKEEN